MKQNNYDVLIVGAGIVGIAHAYHCVRAGLKVALVERDELPRGATVRNFGQVVPSGFGSKWQAYGRVSLQTYLNIQAKFDITVRQEGSIYIANDEDEMQLLEELASINRGNNYSSELLSKEQCLKRYPGLRSSYVKGGLFFPEEIIVDPRQAAHKIIQYCVGKYGLHFIPRTTVLHTARQNGEVEVWTNKPFKLYAGKVIICSGSEFRILYPDRFYQSDIQIVKLQMLESVAQPTLRIPGSILTGQTIRRYESFKECPSYRTIKSKENAQSYTTQKGIHILLKQSPSGSMILGDSHEYFPVKDSGSVSFDMDNKINCYLLGQAQRIFDLEDWRIQRSWLGYYSQCKEQDIYNVTIDDHIHVVTAIGGKGMTAAFGYAQQHVNQLFSFNPA